jgi:hypothetical protein
MTNQTDSERSHTDLCPWCEQQPADQLWPMKQNLCIKCHTMFATWRYTDVDRAWSVIEHEQSHNRDSTGAVKGTPIDKPARRVIR